MKQILFTTIIIATLTTSCDKDFLNQRPSTGIEEEIAIENTDNLESSVIGIYAALSTTNFYGRNALAAVDLLGDLAGFNGGTNLGHLEHFERYLYHDATSDIGSLWLSGYFVIARATRTIEAANRLRPDASAADQRRIDMALAQARSIRALTWFHLVNLFALPYTCQPNSSGIVLADDVPIKQTDIVSRASVAQTYQRILEEINKAKDHFSTGNGNLPSGNVSFFMNEAALFALEARVNLYMGTAESLATAAVSAQRALDKSGTRVATDVEYVPMWTNASTPTPEDIFTINYVAQTQLSSNSMNTLWRFYGGAMYPKYQNLLDRTDIRREMLIRKRGATSMQTLKYPNDDAVNNNPVFRASEMYLIIAEALAATDIPAAQQALFEVAQRNKSLTNAADLPSEIAELLAFIADERARELNQEGHRWFDLRRTGVLMSRNPGETLKDITDFDVKRSVLPIPQGEVNVSKILQNEWGYLPE